MYIYIYIHNSIFPLSHCWLYISHINCPQVFSRLEGGHQSRPSARGLWPWASPCPPGDSWTINGLLMEYISEWNLIGIFIHGILIYYWWTMNGIYWWYVYTYLEWVDGFSYSLISTIFMGQMNRIFLWFMSGIPSEYFHVPSGYLT